MQLLPLLLLACAPRVDPLRGVREALANETAPPEETVVLTVERSAAGELIEAALAPLTIRAAITGGPSTAPLTGAVELRAGRVRVRSARRAARLAMKWHVTVRVESQLGSVEHAFEADLDARAVLKAERGTLYLVARKAHAVDLPALPSPLRDAVSSAIATALETGLEPIPLASLGKLPIAAVSTRVDAHNLTIGARLRGTEGPAARPVNVPTGFSVVATDSALTALTRHALLDEPSEGRYQPEPLQVMTEPGRLLVDIRVWRSAAEGRAVHHTFRVEGTPGVDQGRIVVRDVDSRLVERQGWGAAPHARLVRTVIANRLRDRLRVDAPADEDSLGLHVVDVIADEGELVAIGSVDSP